VAEPVGEDEATKAELQRRMETTRESIVETVEEIKDTVEGRYTSVKETVTGILDWREQFPKDPIVWSVGALATGFALGYTLGRASKGSRRSAGKRSDLAVFADSLVEELGDLGKSLPIATLDPTVKQLFGFRLSDVFAEIGAAKTPSRRRRPAPVTRARRGRGRPPSRARPRHGRA
jgi:hypothetical protein